METFLSIVSRLPMRVLYWFADMAYPVLYHIIRYRKDVVRKNLAVSFPGKTPSELKALEKRFYKYFCDAVVEMVKLYSLDEEEVRKRFVFKNAGQLSEDLKAGKSYILLMSHHCNWEYLTSVPLWLTKDIFGSHVYKRLVDSRFDNIMVKMRDRFPFHRGQETFQDACSGTQERQADCNRFSRRSKSHAGRFELLVYIPES